MTRRRNALLSSDALDMSTMDAPKQATELAKLESISQTAVVTFTESMLTGPEAAHRLTELLNDVRAQGARCFVFDLQNVAMMDSMCVGALIDLITRLQSESRESSGLIKRRASDAKPRMAIVNANRNVAYLFKITKLDRLFPICRDVMSALSVVEGRDIKKGSATHGLLKALGF